MALTPFQRAMRLADSRGISLAKAAALIETDPSVEEEFERPPEPPVAVNDDQIRGAFGMGEAPKAKPLGDLDGPQVGPLRSFRAEANDPQAMAIGADVRREAAERRTRTAERAEDAPVAKPVVVPPKATGSPDRDKYQSFGSMFLAGIDDLQKLTYSAGEAIGEATGNETMEAWGERGRVRNTAEADEYGQPGKFQDIKTFGDAMGWAGQTAGRLIPVMAPAAAGAIAGAAVAPIAGVAATVGGIVGAFVPSLAMGVGEVQGGMKEKDPNAEADGWVFAGGTAIAALDSVLPGKVGSQLVKAFGRDAAEEIAMRTLVRPAASTTLANVAKGAARGAGKGALIEGTTESLQEAIGEVTSSLAAEKKVDWSALPDKMIEAGAAGALMGKAMGGAGGAATAYGDTKAGNKAYVDDVRNEATWRSDPSGTDFTADKSQRQSPLAPQRAPPVDDEDRLTVEDRASPLADSDIAPGKKAVAELLGEDWDADVDDDPTPIIRSPRKSILPTRATPVERAAPPVVEQGGNARQVLKGKIRSVESSGNDNAQNTRSSASGRYQFIDSTFDSLYNRVYGVKLTDATRGAVKNNPVVQERLMDALVSDNEAALRRAGLPPTAGNLYLAHFLGHAGAVKALKNPGAAPSRDVLSANPNLKGMTNADVANWAAKKMGGKGGAVAATAEDDTTIDYEDAEYEAKVAARQAREDAIMATAQSTIAEAGAREEAAAKARLDERQANNIAADALVAKQEERAAAATTDQQPNEEPVFESTDEGAPQIAWQNIETGELRPFVAGAVGEPAQFRSPEVAAATTPPIDIESGFVEPGVATTPEADFVAGASSVVAPATTPVASVSSTPPITTPDFSADSAAQPGRVQYFNPADFDIADDSPDAASVTGWMVKDAAGTWQGPFNTSEEAATAVPVPVATTDKPLAAQGLTSFRYQGPFGPIMIGAKDEADAIKQANRSLETPNADVAKLEVWDAAGQKYVPAPVAPPSKQQQLKSKMAAKRPVAKAVAPAAKKVSTSVTPPIAPPASAEAAPATVSPTPAVAGATDRTPQQRREMATREKAATVRALRKKGKPKIVGTKIVRDTDGSGTKHRVTLSDGTTVDLYRDTDQFGTSNPQWYVDDDLETEDNTPGRGTGSLGSTKAEALANVVAAVERGRDRTVEAAQRIDAPEPTRDTPAPKPVADEAPTRPKPPKALDVIAFLRARGGVRNDEGHDLSKGRGLKRHPGLINNKSGMAIDEAGEALWEANYFNSAGPRPSTADVLELLDNADRRKIYPMDEAVAMASQAAADSVDPDGETRAKVEAAIDEFAVNFNSEEFEDAVQYVVAGYTPGEAVTEAANDAAGRSLEALAEQTGDDFYDTVKDQIYEGEQAEQRDRSVEEGFAGPEGEQGGAGRGAAADAQPESRGQEEADPLGPRADDQRISLERAGQGRMRATVRQKAPGSDGGLFDTADTTGDMFDAPKPAPVPEPVDTLADEILAMSGDEYVDFIDALNPKPSKSKAMQSRSLHIDRFRQQFTDDQIRAAMVRSKKPAPKPKRRVEQRQTPAFKKFFGQSAVVDEDGKPFVVYIGTTGDFDAFDIRKMNIESDMGAGIYASSSRTDVSENYAGEGPDLTSRIDRWIDEAQFVEVREGLYEYEDGDGETFTTADIRRMAKEDLVQKEANDGFLMPVYLSIQKPFVIGTNDRNKGTYLDLDIGLPEITETERDGETVYEVDGETFTNESEAYDYAYDLISDKEPTGALADFMQGLRDAAGEFDADPQEVDYAIASLMEEAEQEGLTAERAMAIVRDRLTYIYDYDKGQAAGNEVIRLAIEKAGFDGIIDNTVNAKFGSGRRGFGGARVGGMAGMDDDTSHYIVFKSEQVKSATGNSGEFDAANPRIVARRGDPATSAMSKLAAAKAEVMATLRAMGAEGRVPVEVVNEIPDDFGDLVEGNFIAGDFNPWSRLIRISAMAVEGPAHTVRHELIHWMREAGVINRTEYSALRKWAEAQPALQKWVDKNYQGLTQDERSEEMVAEGIALLLTGRATTPKGLVATAIKKVRDFINAIVEAFASGGISRADLAAAMAIIDRIETGEQITLADERDTSAATRTIRLRRDLIAGRLTPQEHHFFTTHPAMKYQAAWHGTPREAFDKFDINYLGTGEGAQAFGWGLYFAQAKDIATFYRKKLSERLSRADEAVLVGGVAIKDYFGPAGVGDSWGTYSVASAIADFLDTTAPYNGWLEAVRDKALNEYDKAIADSQAQLAGFEGDTSTGGIIEAGAIRREIEVLQQGLILEEAMFNQLAKETVTMAPRPKGALLGVEIPETEELLDLDATLGNQSPKVKAALEKLRGQIPEDFLELYEENLNDDFWGWTGLELQRKVLPRMAIDDTYPADASIEVMDALDNGDHHKAASVYLKSLGIPGNSYLDSNSRGDGPDNTRNFVIFDDSVIEVRIKQRRHSPLNEPDPSPHLLANLRNATASLISGLRYKRDEAGAAFDQWRTAVQDKMLPLLRIQSRIESILGRPLADEENAYARETLYSSRVGDQLAKLTDDLVEPLLVDLHATGISVEELDEYLYARHAFERNAHISSINPSFGPDEGSGMTNAEAAAVMASVRASGRQADFDMLAAHVDRMVEFSIQTRVDGGLLSLTDANILRTTYRFYVPLRGHEELDPKESGSSARAGKGINITGSETRFAFGRESKANDLLGHVILQAEEAIVRAEKNAVAVAFANMVEASPEPGFWQVNPVAQVRTLDAKTGMVVTTSRPMTAGEKERTVSYKVAGVEQRILLDPDGNNATAMRLAVAMRNLGPAQMGQITQAFAHVGRYLSLINTSYNPEFTISNALRDLQTAALNLTANEQAGLVKGVMLDWLSMKPLLAAHRGERGKLGHAVWDQWAARFQAAGGKVHFNQMDNIEGLRNRLNTELKRKGQSRWNTARQFRGFMALIENANGAVENAIRIAVFKNAIERGYTEQQSAYMAKNVTVNFNRHGTFGPAINAGYVFANASIQGSTIMIQAIAKSRKVQVATAALAMTGLGLDMLNRWLDEEDDEDGQSFYSKIPEYEKSRNFILMAPWLGKGKYIKYPMTWGYNVFPGMGRLVSERLNGDRSTASALGAMMTMTIDAFNPIGGTNSFANFLAPSLLDPVVDINWTGKDFADRPISPDQPINAKDKEPNSQLAWPQTHRVWKSIAEMMNQLGGGDDVTPASDWMDHSPETFQHLFGVATGAAGGFAARLGSLVTRGFDPEAPPLTANDIPMKRKLLGDPPTWLGQSAYYQRMAAAEYAVDRLGRYKENADAEGEARLMREDGDLLAMAAITKAARKTQKELNKTKRAIRKQEKLGKITEERAIEARKALKVRQDALVLSYNTEWIKVIGEKREVPEQE